MHTCLFCIWLVNRFGTENYDYRQFSQLCDQYTGGLDVSSHVSAHYNDLMTMEQGVLFSSYSLDDNLPYMLNLWDDLFCRLVKQLFGNYVLFAVIS